MIPAFWFEAWLAAIAAAVKVLMAYLLIRSSFEWR